MVCGVVHTARLRHGRLNEVGEGADVLGRDGGCFAKRGECRAEAALKPVARVGGHCLGVLLLGGGDWADATCEGLVCERGLGVG